jgi:hypothetical protein
MCSPGKSATCHCRLVMWIGSALMCIGYGGLYLQAAGYITPTLARLITCCVIAGNAGT